jgi:hypothetical protein
MNLTKDDSLEKYEISNPDKTYKKQIQYSNGEFKSMNVL